MAAINLILGVLNNRHFTAKSLAADSMAILSNLRLLANNRSSPWLEPCRRTGVAPVSNFGLPVSGVLFREVDEEHQKVSEVFEDGDRRDACPTPRAADKRLRLMNGSGSKSAETRRHGSGRHPVCRGA